MEPIGIIALLAGIISFRLPVAVGLAIVALASLLGSAAAVTIPGLANIPPAHLILGFVVMRVMVDPARADVLKSLSGPSHAGFWFALTVFYNVVGAYFLPRLFAGRFDVYPISGASSFVQLPLGPENGNITQSVYLIGDFACFLLCTYGNRTEAGFRTALYALIAYAAANLFFAALDIITIRTSTTYLLSFIRNAAYVIYIDVAVGDTKRIIGSFNEASAFAYATIGIFCFTARLWLGGVFKALTFPIALLSIVLILLSTSSTGYVALGPSVALLYFGSVYRILKEEATSADLSLVFAGPCLIAFLVLFVAVDPDLSRWATDLFDTIIAKKSTSDSGIERSALNFEAFKVFVDTYGLGSGLGSVRTSSFVLACLANLGLVGTLLYAIFFTVAFRSGSNQRTDYIAHVRSAARLSCLGSIVAATVSGALVDLGLAFYVSAALANATPQRSFLRQSHPEDEVVEPKVLRQQIA